MTDPDAPRTGEPLTRTQSRIWTSQRLYPEAPLANMGKRSRIAGPLDAERLVRAFDTVVRAAPALRTVIASPGGAPRAVVLDEPPATTGIVDVPASELDRWCEERIAAPIDAASCPYDSVVLRHADDDWTWWLDLHHVVTDAMSSAIVFEATARAYDALGAGTGAGTGVEAAPDVLGPPFATWAAEQRAASDPEDRAARAHEWRTDLDRAGAQQPIAPYGPRGPATTAVRRVDLPLDDRAAARVHEALAGDFRSFSRELALLALVATAVTATLHRLDGRSTCTIGVPVHHRGRGSTDVVGPLMELYPLVVDVDAADTARQLHARVMRGLVTVLRRAKPGESPDVEPDAVVNVLGVRYGDVAGLPTRTEWMRSRHAEPTHPIGVQVYDYDGDVRWVLDLNESLSTDGSHRRFPEHLARGLVAAVADPDAAITGHPLAVDADAAESDLLNPDPIERTGLTPVHELVRRPLADRPEWIVAEHRGVGITAADFDTRADRLAAWLIDRGVTPGRRVGIRMPRGVDVLVAIHASLRAGAAFVLLEPDDPAARHRAIEADADLALILDEIPALDDGPPASPPAVDVDLDDEAYVLYTSGSTGEPKGVPISHRGLADYLAFAVDAYAGPDGPPVVALHSSLVFDLTITSLFLSFLTGGRVVVFDEDPVVALGRIAADDRITFLKATPSQLDVLTQVAAGPLALRTVVVGGEAFRRPTAERLVARCPARVRVFNEYGPTEAVVGCMVHRWDPDVDLGVDVPIGHAATGAEIAVLDTGGWPAPTGSWGELHVRRPGMARGYLNRPGLDEGRFVTVGDDPAIWYRTGDRVRAVRPGVLVYGGRLDDQMKVGGVRLEPAEVEVALVGHPAVGGAVVRLWTGADRTDDGVLTAWYQTVDGARLDPDELRAHLRRLLPERAVPTAFVHLAELPLAASAKVDVRSLPAPADHDRQADAFTAPATPTEEHVAAIVRERLQLERVGVHDDFFDIGGASLSALEVVAAIGDRFGCDLPDVAVFTARTVRGLAAMVEAAPEGVGPRRRPAEGDIPRRPGPPELSTGQAALLFDLRADPGTSRYSVTRHYRLGGPIDAGRFRDALRAVIAGHDTLRFTFATPRRELAPDEALDWRLVAEPVADVEAFVDALARDPLDVDGGPLVRAVLLDGPRPELVLTLHHLWCDARSFDVLWHDLAAAYRGAALEPPAARYSDHAAWQSARVSADDIAHWTAALAAVDHSPDLGLRRPDQPEPDRLAVRSLALARDRRRARTTFADFLVAVDLVLSRYTDDPVVVGVPMTVRDRPEADEMVGYFLNTVVLALPDARHDPPPTVGGLAAEIERDVAAAIRHRHVPLADVMAARRRAGSVEPLAGVMVVHDPEPHAGVAGLAAEGRTVFNGSAVTELSLLAADTPSGVDVSAEWSGARYAGADVEALLAELVDVFARVTAAEPVTPVADLPAPGPADLAGEPLPELEPVTVAIWRHRGDGAAVRQGDETLTYDELTRAADRVADGLRARGVQPGDRVALLLSRSTDQVVAILGVLRAGAAYVPVDRSAPPARIERILGSVDPVLVIVEDGGEAPARFPAAPVGALAGPFRTEPPDLPAPPGLDGPAYVIHTSGSTGEPRGVEVTHRQLAASTAARAVEYHRSPCRFVWTSSYGFDSSIVGLFWTLVTGGELVLPAAGATVDVDHLIDVVEGTGATDVLTVPSLWGAVLRRVEARGSTGRLGSLESVIVAGEAVPPEVVARHLRSGIGADLFNEYGPTEATVWATVHRCDEAEDPVPIGHAVPGARLRVAGADGRPRPIGVVGELLIGGAGLTAGYVDDPVATAERFVTHAGRRWYRTGDATVRRADGVIEFVGRLDDQLSVNGVRVEPDEIERAAESFGAVRAALARVETLGRTPALVLHVDAEGLDVGALERHLRDRLPDPLLPRRVAVHPELPRTVHGKLDRRAALDTGPGPATTGTRPPAPDGDDPTVLGHVIRVWQDVFGDGPAVDGDSDFFALGGSSLAAVELVVALEAELGTNVTIGALLNGRTPRGVAAAIGATADIEPPRTAATEAATTADRLVVLRPAVGPAPRSTVVMVPAWDDVFGYVALVEDLVRAGLDPAVEVLGLQYRVPTAGAGVQTVPELTEIFQRDLAGSRGPYTFVGWSTSGLVAYDLGRCLSESGAEVELVALVDTYFPGEERHLWANRWNKYQHLLRPRATGEVVRELRKAVLRRARRLAAVLGRRLLRWGDPSALPAARAAAPVSRVFPPGAFAYDAREARVPIVLYSATATNEARTAHAWRAVATRLEVVPVEGRHRGLDSIMDPGRVQVIADDLARRIGS